MNHSNALKMVIASLLVSGVIGGTEKVQAAGYCIPNGGCYVSANPFPGIGGGAGGGWGAGDGSSSGHNDDPRLWCFEFPSTVWQQSQGQCDVYAPPPLEVNGCGTAGGFPVPDYWVSPVSAATALGFGNVLLVHAISTTGVMVLPMPTSSNAIRHCMRIWSSPRNKAFRLLCDRSSYRLLVAKHGPTPGSSSGNGLRLGPPSQHSTMRRRRHAVEVMQRHTMVSVDDKE